MSETRTVDVIVAGGGVTGLAAAAYLAKIAPQLRVALLEAEPNLGGKVRGAGFADGQYVDMGPDSIVVDTADLASISAAALATMTTPRSGGSGLWAGDRVTALPPGLLNGMLSHPLRAARGGLLSWHGLLRASADLVLPRTRWQDDISVAELVGRRMGREVTDRIITPVVGGICAGDPSRLSAQALLPSLFSVLHDHRSLLWGMRSVSPAAPRLPHTWPERGLSTLVDDLLRSCRGVTVATEQSVVAIAQRHDHWLVSTATGRWESRLLVLAMPARDAAQALRAALPAAAQRLGALRAASVVVATLDCPLSPDFVPPATAGFLVDPRSGLTVTALTVLSERWRHHRTGNAIRVRVSLGRDGDTRALEMSDEELRRVVISDAQRLLPGLPAPREVLLQRWPQALPQYDVGHTARVRDLRAALPGSVVVCGAAFDGIGLPACLRSGENAAAAVVQSLPKSAWAAVA